jgi:hypothetical protein
MSATHRRAVVLALPGLFVAARLAHAHHGWGGYDAANPLELTGTVESSAFENPHGILMLKTDAKTWEVVLAPPFRLQARGVTPQMLAVGATLEAYGYPHRTRDIELRAEWIRIAGTTYQLR